MDEGETGGAEENEVLFKYGLSFNLPIGSLTDQAAKVAATTDILDHNSTVVLLREMSQATFQFYGFEGKLLGQNAIAFIAGCSQSSVVLKLSIDFSHPM